MSIFKRKKIELTTPTEVYALEPGKTYLLEIDKRYTSLEQVRNLYTNAKAVGIHLIILPVEGGKAITMSTPEQICTTGCATKRCKRANREIK